MSVLHLALILLIPFPFVPHCKDCEANPAAVKAFKWLYPCPSTGQSTGSCRGYVVDHKVPLACGGPDIPRNMQWQTKAQERARDRVESPACRKQR
jgi:hypothetical protein